MTPIHEDEQQFSVFPLVKMCRPRARVGATKSSPARVMLFTAMMATALTGCSTDANATSSGDPTGNQPTAAATFEGNPSQDPSEGVIKVPTGGEATTPAATSSGVEAGGSVKTCQEVVDDLNVEYGEIALVDLLSDSAVINSLKKLGLINDASTFSFACETGNVTYSQVVMLKIEGTENTLSIDVLANKPNIPESYMPNGLGG